MNRLACVLLLLACTTGCPPTPEPDYYMLSEGHTWEYFLIDGGTEGAHWTLETHDPSLNLDEDNGDLYVVLGEVAGEAAAVQARRRFNLEQEFDYTGPEPVPTDWSYKWAYQGEGDDGELFVVKPERNEDWSASWQYSMGGGDSSEFEVEVSASFLTEPVNTSYGQLDDAIVYHRILTVTNQLGDGTEQVLVTDWRETWAANIGLVHFKLVSGEEVTEGTLRTTTAADAPGT